MTITQAVIARTTELLKERKMTKRQLARQAHLSEGTLASIFKQLAKSVTLATLYSLAYGFGMTIKEFMNSPYFDEANIDLPQNKQISEE